MRERSERLFEALSEISEQKIDEASPSDRTSRSRWKKWGVLAAALVLVVGVGSQILPRLGGNAGGNGAGRTGEDGASVFMSYAGPVFPLILKEEDSAVTAEREITLDFAPWVPVWWSNQKEADSREGLTPEQRQEVLDNYNEWYPEGGRWRSSTDIQVTDAYTLTNTSAQDRTVSVLCPFVSSFQELDEHWPALTADGQVLETALHAGQFSGGYQGPWGGTLFTEAEPGSMNLMYANSWTDYKDLIDDTDYLENALEDWPDFSGVPVIVYEFTDPWGPEEDEKAGIPNPTLRNSFDLDYSRTIVLSYGFNGTSRDLEKGWMDKQFSIPVPGAVDDGMPRYLIVVGEDIGPIQTQGYPTGGWDTKETVEAGVTVKRYETDLEDILRTVLRQRYDRNYEGWDARSQDFELYFGLMKDQLLVHGVLAKDPMERYGVGSLEDLDAYALDRIFYLEAQVTIPAGGSVTLTAEMTKEGSYDFYCAHTKNRDVYGYDTVTRLGSNLTCTGQTAVLEDRGQIEIVRQNFGFDLENGINEVALDPDQEHYYLEVKRLSEE